MKQTVQNLTPEQRAFLEAYGKMCSITSAAKAAKIDRRTHYEWLDSDEAYRIGFADAKLHVYGLLEAEAVRRGIRPEKYRRRAKKMSPGLEALLSEIVRQAASVLVGRGVKVEAE